MDKQLKNDNTVREEILKFQEREKECDNLRKEITACVAFLSDINANAGSPLLIKEKTEKLREYKNKYLLAVKELERNQHLLEEMGIDVNLSILNRDILISNINYLDSRKLISMAEIERRANQARGYYSKIRNDSSKIPSIAFLMAFAEAYGITVDTLLNVDLQSLAPAEARLHTFFSKLILDTQNEEIKWKMFNMDNFLDDDGMGNVIPTDEKHPLLTIDFDEEYGLVYAKYNSLLEKEGGLCMNGNSYSLSLPKQPGAELQIIRLTDELSNNIYEVYIFDQATSPILSTSNAPKVLVDDVVKLYTQIELGMSHIQISDAVLGIIDNYLN